MTLEERVRCAVQEDIAIVSYDPLWAELFEQEREHLRSCFPLELLGRIEHFGSTAVPGLPAKPVVDMLFEVTDLGAAKSRIAPILEAQGYDYFFGVQHSAMTLLPTTPGLLNEIGLELAPTTYT